MNKGPGVIVNTPKSRRNSTAGGRHRRRSSRRSTVQLGGGSTGGDMDGIDVERLSYINTALEAVPGITLRRYFAPVMRVRSRLMTRARASKQRLSRFLEGDAATNKSLKDAMNQLCTALTNAAGDVLFDAPLSVDAGVLLELLKGKVEPVSYRAEDTLSLPCEPAEASFVYIVISGSVRVTHFHQQLRRGAAPPSAASAAGSSSAEATSPAAVSSRGVDRKQFFTSSEDVFHLCTTGGISTGFDGGVSGEGTGAGETDTVIVGGNYAHNSNINNDVVSVSNMTTAIQRSLRKASRALGQPTLLASRTEVLRAPCVLGAVEALGLGPGRYAACTATATVTSGAPAKNAAPDGAYGQGEGGGGGGNGNGVQYVDYTDVLRVRSLDVHAALVELARREKDSRGSSGEWLSAPMGALPPRGVPRTVGDFVAAARAKALASFYPQNEILMRQSWLLQDTPPVTLRNLISRLAPRTYMPGEIIACPHMNSIAARQLCFLRRGRLLILESPAGHIASATGKDHTRYNADGRDGSPHSRVSKGGDAAATFGGSGRICARCSTNPFPHVLEVVHAGASFGELSVLFGEARSYTLVADSVCDVWCLPHSDFAGTMRRDDNLRATLVEKAAALRIKWLGEQRFTPALAEHLRAHSQLFRPFCNATLRLIQERVEPVVYSPGQLITSTSERCEEVIFVMQGHVESICEGVAAYGPGDVLGEGCLIAHRWPLSLAARTMVEGWRMSRAKLIDALERADKLHAHSGETTSQAPSLMKQIYLPPVPEVESDVVGRLRMPVVGPAPGGLSYPEFARRTAEVLIKALCFTYRDYVKWEDINYATMDSGKASRELAASDALARDFAIATLRGEVGVASSSTAAKGSATAGRPSTATQPPYTSIADAVATHSAAKQPRRSVAAAASDSRNTTASGAREAAAGSGCAAASRIASDRRAASFSGASRKQRAAKTQRSNTGACAFLVNPATMHAPFTRRPPNCRADLTPSLKRSPSAQLTSSNASFQQPVPTGATSIAVRKAHKMPPRLRNMTQTLAERDRVLSNALREEAELEKKLAAQQRATVREHLATTSLDTPANVTATAPTTTTAAAAAACPDKAASDAAANTVMGTLQAAATAAAGRFEASDNLQELTTVAAPLLVSDPVPLVEPMPPVHIFLSGERPRSEITMAEALSIGYVLQLPDSHSIQSCVSFVDPDVTVGPPAQRARRHQMAVTPNDRYHKHNFLFAAAVFENLSKLEEKLQGMHEEEQLRIAKAQKLMTMLRANVSSVRWHADHNDVYQQDVLLSPGADGMGDSASRERSPMNSATRGRSPSGTALVSPMRAGGGSNSAAAAALGGSRKSGSMPTPSPFRGSPGKSSAKREEAFERMLRRDANKAVELLVNKYQLNTSAPATTLQDQPPLTLSESQEGAFNDNATSSSAAVAAAPRRKPSLLDRMRDATNTTAVVEDRDGSDDGVQLTNAAATTLELPVANYRDRHHAQQCYLNTVERQFAGAGDGSCGSPQALSTSALLLGAAQFATLEDHLTQRKDSVLFVDGYGALEVCPEAQAAGSVVLAPDNQSAARSGVPPADNADSVSAGLEEGSNHPRRQRTLSRSATATFANGSFSVSGMLAEPLKPQDFVMPDVEDANAVMRRIQRDIEGLNAVAKEQTRERRAAREKERQLGAKHVRAAATALAKPTADEARVLEDWQRATHFLSRDPIAPVTVPDALRPQAGPDHLRRGVDEVNEAVAAEAARDAAAYGVVAWQDEQLTSDAGAVTSARTPGGGLRFSGPSGGAADDDPASAKRTIAAIGTGQLGYRSRPLVSLPVAAMDRSEHQRYVQEREAFFEAFKRNPSALLTGDLVEPQRPRGLEGVRGATGTDRRAAGGQQQQQQLPYQPHPPPSKHTVTTVTEDERRFVPWV